MATALSIGNVVVWSSKCFSDLFIAFEPNLSNQIETAYASTFNNNFSVLTVPVGSIDLRSRILTDLNGRSKSIKRCECPSSSVFGRSKVWEFKKSSSRWESFDIDSMQLLEDAADGKKKDIHLKPKSAVGFEYKVDLKSFTQKNTSTGKKRPIRWRDLKEAYVTSKDHVLGRASAKIASHRGNIPVNPRKEREPLPGKQRVYLSKLAKSSVVSGEECLKFTRPVTMPTAGTDTDRQEGKEEEECPICFGVLSEESSYGEGQVDAHQVVQLTVCQHVYHKLCLVEMYQRTHKEGFLQCPSCKCIYGEKIGDCPAGSMEWKLMNGLSLPGNPGCDTIQISYNIDIGMQVEGHPNPGKLHVARGFPRRAYLPDCCKGRKVLKLLMEAFSRRLVFTVGTSSTDGLSNSVIWNDIHHKTDCHNNAKGHGYPDPNYLDNVLMELASVGITEDCIED